MNNDNSRLLAFKILQKYFPEKTNVSQLLSEQLSNCGECKDKGFVRELVWGTVRYLNTLDYFIDSFLKEKKLKNPVRNILRLGALQLIYLPQRVPSYAAINESVELCRLSDQENYVALVNAVLRNLDREKTKLAYPDREKDITQYYSIRHSHPDWMVSRWLERFGEKDTDDLLISNNIYPSLTIRANTLKISRDKLKRTLEDEGIPSEYTKYSPDGLILSINPELETLESFQNGYFVIQDEASQLISYLLNPLKNELVLDLCCGSGIKTGHIAQIANQECEIISADNSIKQIESAKKSVEKLGLAKVKFLNEDVRTLKGFKADKILLDAPCSGLGAIRRKPDIKWNRSLKMIVKNFPILQKELLYSAADLLKAGGVLVYSTCTTEPEENENLIFEFLKKFKNFTPEKLAGQKIFQELTDESGYFMKTSPHKHGTDGFFAAKLKAS